MNIDERYKEGKIYKLICCETLDIYIGSTIMNLNERIKGHRRNNNNCESKNFVEPLIELIEDYPCNNKLELRQREQYHIDNNECVNKYRTYRTEEQIKEECKERNRKWLEVNREKKKEKSKQYYYDNIEKMNEKFKCECGVNYTYQHKKRHERSKKHLDFIV